MATAAHIEINLRSLHSAVNEGDYERTSEYVSNITQLCLNDLSQTDIDYCCSLIFNAELGLVAFLKKTLLKDELQDSRSQAFDLLQTLFKKYGDKIVPYILDIKDVCISTFSRDKAAKSKNAALIVLIETVQESAGSRYGKDLDIPKMIEKFLMELATASSKHTSTVLGNIYHLLGVIAELYPEHMTRYSTRLFDIYVGVLKAQVGKNLFAISLMNAQSFLPKARKYGHTFWKAHYLDTSDAFINNLLMISRYQLKMTSKSKKTELPCIAGCFRGLTRLLVNFTQSAEEGGKYAEDIYKFVRMALNKDVQVSRYEMQQSALQLLAAHACQWDRYIFRDYEKLFSDLVFWSRHHNTDVLHDGVAAFDSFLKQVCIMLVSRARSGQKDIEIFMFLLQHFRAIMNSPESTSKQISQAIRGYGLLAEPCRVFLTEADVRFMYNDMILCVEQIYFGSQSDVADEKLMNLPNFLEAFSYILLQLEQIPDAMIMSLERLVVLMIECYPQLNKKFHYFCFVSILRIYFAISHQGSVFNDFLSRTIYQAVIRTCSHKPALEIEDVTIPGRYQITYKSYLHFWGTILQTVSVKELGQSFSLAERQLMATLIYDELMDSILKILSRLDLSTTQRSEAEKAETGDQNSGEEPDEVGPATDSVGTSRAIKPKDIVVFVNLVDFCRDLLLEGDHQHESFRPWVYKFGKEIVQHSTRQPLVSGLYKLLTVCLRLCTKLSYFKGLAPVSASDDKGSSCNVEADDSAMECDLDKQGITDLVHREASFSLFAKFSKEVSVQLKQFHDDLLASCLTMILSMPDEIVVHQISIVIPALQKSILVGRSYLPLARVSLDTLEHWSSCHISTIVSPYYPELLPLLDVYIKSSHNLGLDNGLQDRLGKKFQNMSMKKKLLKLKTQRLNDKGKDTTGELETIKNRCFNILGMLGGSVNHALIKLSDPAHIAKLAVTWSMEQHLPFDVPFQDLKPTIHFDVFLPRVVELATSSGNRRTKIAACELLHAIVLFMIGREAQVLGRRSVAKESLSSLYKRVFPAIMQLVCDVEMVARQLFKPFLFQLIHWFTSNQMQTLQHSATFILLDTILDGLVNPTDAALRDLSGVSLREFVHWSIKQSTPQQLEKTQLSIKSVLRRLYSYARHPSAFKRLGAALGFNCIYTLFREDETLVDMFTFEVLVTYIESLALAHTDEKILGTQDQCKMVLNHLERIMRVKADLLNKKSDRRRIPNKLWKNGTLAEVVDWLLLQCGRPQTECRHACMQLVYTLAPCLPGNRPVQHYFEDLLKKNSAFYFIQRFERSAFKSDVRGSSCDIYSCRPSMDKETVSLVAIENWFELVLTSLDCYTWLFGQNLLVPEKILTAKCGSSFIPTIVYFTEEFATSTVDHWFGTATGAAQQLTPRERENFNRLKCTVIVRMFSFICILLGKYHSIVDQTISKELKEFWNDKLWDTLVACIFDPTSVGFNMADIEIVSKLPEATCAVLTCLRKSDKVCTHFQKRLAEQLEKSEWNLQVPSTINNSSVNLSRLSQVVAGYSLLNSSRYLDMKANSKTGVDFNSKISKELVCCVYQSLIVNAADDLKTAQLSIEAIDVCRKILQLGFALGFTTKQLSDLIMDDNVVRMSTSGCRLSHGELFFVTFKSTITEHLVTVFGELMTCLTNDNDQLISARTNIIHSLIVGVLEAIGRDTKLRHRYGIAVVDAVLARWSHFQCWWDDGRGKATLDTKMMALTVLTKILIVNASVVTNEQHSAHRVVWSMYCRLLTDSTTELTFKSRVLDLLMFFVSTPYNTHSYAELRSSLDAFVSRHFPTSSTEYTVGSPKYNDYIAALDKLLSALELAPCPLLLELFVSIMCREKRHVYAEKIQETISNVIKRSAVDLQGQLLNAAYEFYRNDGRGLTPDQRRSALENVCLHLLTSASTAALVTFFEEHIGDIMASVEMKRTGKMTEMDMVKVLCSLQLVEVMYRQLPKDDVHSKTSRINKKYWTIKKTGVDMTGKEMTTSLTKTATDLRAEDFSRLTSSQSIDAGGNQVGRLIRLVHCAAYNVLIAVVSSTQTDIKFYNGFLFPADNLAKGQQLWEHLIDLEKKYDFPIEMDASLVRRKEFIEIRKQLQDDESDETDGDITSGPPVVRYLASQYLVDSSLNTDVSQFDFATSASSMKRSEQLSQGTFSSSRSMLHKQKSALDAASFSDTTTTYVELELDELNRHECMSSLIRLLQHMEQNKITPAVQEGVTPVTMPGWMDNLNKKMSSTNCPFNVKLLIAKLILNCEAVFRPYGKFWISSLVDLILCKEFQTTTPTGLNYFVNDILVTLLAWHKTATPLPSAINQVLEMVLSHCHHENRQVLRNNVEVLKTMVEVWRQSIMVPTKLLFDNISDKDAKSKRNATGIQMLAVFVANDIVPYRYDYSVDKDRFYQQLVNNLNNDSRSVYAAAAETIGMTLSLLAKVETTDSERKWRESLIDDIAKAIGDKRPDRMIICLHGIQQHFAEFSDRFRAKLFYWMPKLHGDYLVFCLEIIRRRVDHFEKAFLELKSKGFEDMLSHRDERMQLTCLGIVHALLRQLNGEDLKSLMPKLSSFASHPSTACRSAMYDIFMWIYDNYKEGNDSAERSANEDSLWLKAKNVLLVGLSDSEEVNKLRIRNFWGHEARLPTGTFDRLYALFEKMYSPESETQFLSYVTNFLLEMTSRSPDYNRSMFEQPLSECKFENYHVESTWRQRHVAMTPLFVETLAPAATQISTSDASLATGFAPAAGSAAQSGMLGKVRQTMEPANFTATQVPGGDQFYNWLTQSHLDTFADVPGSFASLESSGGQSRLMFSIGRGPQSAVRTFGKTAVGPDFGKGRLGKQAGKDEVDGTGDGNSAADILRLKKRFIRHEEDKSRIFFAKRQSRLNRQRELVEKERKERRENEVTMYRQYRIGDLPDIQIPYSALIAPLQGLAHNDSVVARHLFSSLFTSIFGKIEDDLSAAEANRMISRIGDSISKILKSTTQFYTPFIACFLDVLLLNVKKLKVDASVVNTVCVASQLQPIGVLLLEEVITQSETEQMPKSSKRAKLDRSTLPVNVQNWIELARLYKSMGEYASVQGILGSHVSTHKVTSEAIEAEMCCDYSRAVKLYNEGLAELSSGNEKIASDAELDLWEESRLKCYDELCRWDKIEQICEKMLQAGSSYTALSAETSLLDQVWNDGRQELILPCMIRSKVKRLIEGAEDQQPLLNFIDAAMLSPDKKAILEMYYSEQLALLNLWQDNYKAAQYYANIAKSAFLQEWESLDELMVTSRSLQLQTVQRLVELQEFLTFMSDDGNLTANFAVNLVKRWVNRRPDTLLDQTNVWDDTVTNRFVYMDHIASAVSKKSNTRVDNEFDRYKVSFRLQQVDASAMQGNYTVALHLLKLIQKDALKSCDDTSLHWKLAFARTHQSRCRQMTSLTLKDKLKALRDTKLLLAKLNDQQSQQLLVESFRISADIALNENWDVASTDDCKTLMAEIAGCPSPTTSRDEIVKRLIEAGFQSMESAASDVMTNVEASSKTGDVVKTASEVHLSLYKYCDHYLRLADESKIDAVSSESSVFDSFPQTVVTSLLTSMKYNSVEARRLFPRLLQIVAAYPKTVKEFAKKVSEVPCWMLLSWVGQMTAVLDKVESPAVHDVLLNIAQQYPQALVYPYRLSAESYRFDVKTQEGKKNKDVSDRLRVMLSKNRVLNKFVTELEQFDQPNAVFKEWWSDTDSAVQVRNADQAVRRVTELFSSMSKKLVSGRGRRRDSDDELFDDYSLSSDESSGTPPGPGPYIAQFQNKFSTEIEKLCGKDGCKLKDAIKAGIRSKAYEQFRKAVVALLDQMQNFSAPPSTLKEYSPWMSSFQASNFDDQLEIPGQYSGYSKPIPEYHTKISSFTETVLVMTSIRRPKRITVRGNDEKEYKYLVKCGEDLRQDQRIEQLLELMNELYDQNVSCRMQRLHMRTYQVVPMTSRVGVIEWMDHTAPLLEMIENAKTEEERTRLQKNNPAEDHNKFIGNRVAQAYYSANKKYSRSDVVNTFRKRENLLPPDLLQRVYRRMSVSSEAYYRLRNEFAKSHAQLCISHYLLGIGDRHLSNFMLDLQTGAIIGIDFGHAFGSATQFLPIPELLPFRLTRQLRNVMLPLQEKGLMESVMIHCMQALRSSAELLLTMMDIFIKEPSLDWQQNAERQKRAMDEPSSESAQVDESWYPREKVRFAKRKLLGENCAFIMRDELKLGHGKKSHYDSYEKILLGNGDDNIRARLPATGLNADQQVQALIDLATDPNILGRSWVGWAPWV